MALVGEESGRQILTAVDDAAATAGLVPGQPLAAARAELPDLTVWPADPAGDARALTQLAAWCGRYSPWTAPDGGHDAGGAAGVLIDATGCAHLFGGEAAMLDDLLARLGDLGFSARAAMAGTPGAAWALARFATRGAAPAYVAPVEGEREHLAPLPPAALRLTAGECALLRRLGLRRIADLLALPPATLSPRLGRDVTRRLDQALGRIAEPVNPRAPAPALWSRKVFAEPIAAPEDLNRASAMLAADLAHRLEAAGQGVRRLRLTGYRLDGQVTDLTLGTHRASRDKSHLNHLLAGRLAELDPGPGVEALVLAATGVEPLRARQEALPRHGEADADDLASLLDRLATRLGPEAITRPAARESHLPERMVRPAGPFESAPAVWPGTAPRPVRLLTRPRPIEAIALLPDHPPVRLRLNRQRLRVTRAEGPRRLEPEWWRDTRTRPTRDYFRVETETGRRYWVVRAAGRWYLHGLCA